MPSRGEGFGLVYIEAMRWGVPVVTSIHDGGQEVNVHNKTGCNMNLDRQVELAERIVELLQNSDRAAEFGSAGRDQWRTHFRFSAFRERFAPLVDRVVAG
jgi:phosphatidylinositol alpha-1,6-mannosyltransferase